MIYLYSKDLGMRTSVNALTACACYIQHIYTQYLHASNSIRLFHPFHINPVC